MTILDKVIFPSKKDYEIFKGVDLLVWCKFLAPDSNHYNKAVIDLNKSQILGIYMSRSIWKASDTSSGLDCNIVEIHLLSGKETATTFVTLYISEDIDETMFFNDLHAVLFSPNKVAT